MAESYDKDTGGNMKDHLRSLIAIIGALLFIAPGLLRAQATGEITGTVGDPSGAVVPNVRVAATHTATGVSRFTITSRAGTYTIPLLPVGTYSVNRADSNMAELLNVTLKEAFTP